MAEQVITDQGGAPAASPQPNPEGSPQPEMISYEARNIPTRYGRDFNAVVHDANQYNEAQTQGFGQLAEAVRQAGVSPFELANRLPGMLNPEPAPVQPEVDPMAGWYPPPDPQPLTQDAVEALFAKHDEERDAKFQEMLSGKIGELTTAREQAEQDRSERQRESMALIKSMGGLGMERKPTEFDFQGLKIESDPRFDANAQLVMNTADDLFSADWKRNGGDPDKRPQYVPDAFIEAAADGYKDHFVASEVDAGARAIERQEQLPGGTVPAGAGGTPQIDTSDMTDDQIEHEAMSRAGARGALQGKY